MRNPNAKHIPVTVGEFVGVMCILLIALAFVVMCALCHGCAVNATEAAMGQLELKSPEARLAAIEELGDLRDPRGVPRLVEAFANYPDTREDAAKALVRRGREIFREHPKGPLDTGASANVVVVELWKIGKLSIVDASIRGKIVWVLAEIRDRRVEDWICGNESRPGICAGGSTAVGEEVAISRDKLGFTDTGHEFELLGDGHTYSSKYDPAARGHIEEVE